MKLKTLLEKSGSVFCDWVEKLSNWTGEWLFILNENQRAN